jgi:DinB superfamily
MKRALGILLFAVTPLITAESGAMTEAERTYLIDQMVQSKNDMLASIDGLSAAQWKFKPAPDVWSVQECAEHIVRAEGLLFGMSQQVLKSPAVARLETSNTAQDEKLVAKVKDRSVKGKAPEALIPSGKFATPADAAQAFTEARDNSIAYAKSTSDELRTHIGKGPVGDMDAYQVLLLMAAHSARHTAQIREVEANSGYPKATAKAVHTRATVPAGAF